MSRFLLNLPTGPVTPAEAGGYKIIYADPPWAYDDQGGSRGVLNHYSTMTFEHLASLPIESLAAPDCALFLWATYPKLEEALALIPRWGFAYKSIAFQWVKIYEKSQKPFFGMGRWTRGNTEPCLLAVRGKPSRVSASVSQLILDNELLVAPVGKHSAKPPEAREKIVQLMGNLPRVELFARNAVEGWHGWGNQYPTPDGIPALTLEANERKPCGCPGYSLEHNFQCGVPTERP